MRKDEFYWMTGHREIGESTWKVDLDELPEGRWHPISVELIGPSMARVWYVRVA